jgi:hypothetical protein
MYSSHRPLIPSPQVLSAISDLEEATKAVGRLQAHLADEPYIERISIPSILLARPVAPDQPSEVEPAPRQEGGGRHEAGAGLTGALPEEAADEEHEL